MKRKIITSERFPPREWYPEIAIFQLRPPPAAENSLDRFSSQTIEMKFLGLWADCVDEESEDEICEKVG